MRIRNFNFKKNEGRWYYVTVLDLKSQAIMMPASTWALIEFAANGHKEITLRMLRKNTLERVKISLGRSMYMKGGALYYILDYTGARFGVKEIGRKKIWLGNVTRKVLNNFPEVINLTW